MNEYRINVRFNLRDKVQRNTVEFLKCLDREKYGSRNTFAVAAISAYVEELEKGEPNSRLLEDIRRIFREEVRNISVSPVETVPSLVLADPLSAEEKEENARNVLSALEAF